MDFVLPGLLAGTVGSIVSPGGTGKSMFALQIALQIASGYENVGFATKSGRVAYLAAEDPVIAIHHRLYNWGQTVQRNKLAETKKLAAENLLFEPLVRYQPDLLNPEWIECIRKIALGRRLLILDTLRRFHSADENDSSAMSQVVSTMEKIAAETGCSIIFIHHTSKSASMSGLGGMQQASRGSSVLVDNTRWAGFLQGMSASDANGKFCDNISIGENDWKLFVQFGVSKPNYGPPLSGQWYKRSANGVLTPVTIESAAKPRQQSQSFGGRKRAA